MLIKELQVKEQLEFQKKGKEPMQASDMVKKYGESLIGQTVLTMGVGDYPGGEAKVVDLGDGVNASEIVMNVFNENWKDEDGNQRMGIFHWEIIAFARAPVVEPNGKKEG